MYKRIKLTFFVAFIVLLSILTELFLYKNIERSECFERKEQRKVVRHWERSDCYPCGENRIQQLELQRFLHIHEAKRRENKFYCWNLLNTRMLYQQRIQEERAAEIPLPKDLIEVLYGSCLEYEVPFCMAISVMEQESGFYVDALNKSGCYGLMQLNPKWFPSGLSPAENIKAGVGYLGELLSRYESAERALTAYYYGPSYRLSSWYSDEVMERMKLWEDVVGRG